MPLTPVPATSGSELGAIYQRLAPLRVEGRLEQAATAIQQKCGPGDQASMILLPMPFILAKEACALMGGRWRKRREVTGADEGEWLRQEAALKSRQVLNSDQRCEANAALSGRPATMAVELLDFGPLSIFLSGMRYADLKKIAASYGIPSRDGPHLIKSWIRSISALRNDCAHHTRCGTARLLISPPCPIWVHCLTSII